MVNILWIGKGCEIAATILLAGIALIWIRVKNGNVEIATERLQLVKWFSFGLLIVLAIGFILELSWDINQWQTIISPK